MAKKKSSTKKSITVEDVLRAQDLWANAIVDIGHAYTTGKDVVKRAADHIAKLYAYGDGDTVLFKPTKCKTRQFRLTVDGALSYFVGQELSQSTFSEDAGFAIAPFVSVKFMNAEIITQETRAIAMGNYFFTTDGGDTVKVEYTFGYRLKNGELKIDVHHSSIPYSG